MSKEIEISGEFCPRNVNLEQVAIGLDSEVYRLGDLALKVYCRSFIGQYAKRDLEVMTLYRDITNLMADPLQSAEMRMGNPFSKFVNYRVEFNPILQMYRCGHCGFISTVSPFVEGECLNRSLSFDQKELTILLRSLNMSLEERLGVSGVNVIPLNAKLIGDKVVVTDICSDLLELRPKII